MPILYPTMDDNLTVEELFQHHAEGVKAVFVKLKEHQTKIELYKKHAAESLANIRLAEEYAGIEDP